MNENPITSTVDSSVVGSVSEDVVKLDGSLAVYATTSDNERLSPEELVAADKLSGEINLQNDAYVSTYGSEAQKEVARFSRETLNNTRIYEIGVDSQKVIRNFKHHLTEFKTIKKPEGLFGLLARFQDEIKWWMQKYEKVTKFIDEIEEDFRKQINELTVDLKINNKASEINIRNRRALLVHISAGKMALDKARSGKLVELKKTAEETKARSDIEIAKDFSKKCDEFELKLGRLGSSLAITYIRKPEIDLLRDSENKTIALFNDFIVIAIPLWLSEMSTSLKIQHIKKANDWAEDCRTMSDELFLSNIELLGESAEAAVKNAGSGIISNEAIIAGTDKLLATIEKIDIACSEAIENSRRYEQERAKNNNRIVEYETKSIS